MRHSRAVKIDSWTSSPSFPGALLWHLSSSPPQPRQFILLEPRSAATFMRSLQQGIMLTARQRDQRRFAQQN